MHCRQARELAQEIGYQQTVIGMTVLLGEMLELAEEKEEALGEYERVAGMLARLGRTSAEVEFEMQIRGRLDRLCQDRLEFGRAISHLARLRELTLTTGSLRAAFTVLNQLGNACFASRMPWRAEAYHRQALEAARSATGEEAAGEEEVGIALFNIGDDMHLAGFPEESIAYYRRALRTRSAPIVYKCHVGLGVACMSLGRAQEARPHLRRCIRLCREAISGNDTGFSVYSAKATAEIAIGRATAGVETLRLGLATAASPQYVHAAIQDLQVLDRSPGGVRGVEDAVTLLAGHLRARGLIG